MNIGFVSLTRMMHLFSANCVVSNTKWRLVMFATIGVASAQEAINSGALIEEVTITGSRVPRADLKSSSPVTVVSAEELGRSQSLEIERALSSLPQVAGTVGATSNFVTASGIATVDQPDLGPARTLVLMNGRRMVAAGSDGVVDLNTMPPTDPMRWLASSISS